MTQIATTFAAHSTGSYPFFGTEEWTARKAAIEEHLQEASPIYPSRSVAEMHPPVSTALDTIHWYMYLAENFLTSVAKYEPTQGACILPVFARLGADLEVLTQVKGAPGRQESWLRPASGLSTSPLAAHPFPRRARRYPHPRSVPHLRQRRSPGRRRPAHDRHKLLGHTQVQTTARYAHLANDPVKSAANRIASRIAEVTG